MGEIKNRIKNGQERIKREVIEKTSGYILAALGFVVGLAWNDAVKALIDDLFPLNKDGIFAKFAYALLATIIIIAATIILTRKTEKEKIEKK